MRQFVKGEAVKVQRIGHDQKPFWSAATYDKSYERWDKKTVHMVRIGQGGLHEFLDQNITGYRPVDPDKVRENGKQHAGTIRDLVIQGMQMLLRSEHWLPVTVEEDEGIIKVGNDITIDPEAIESQSIVGFYEREGWVVNTWHTISNYPKAPDDVESRAEGMATTPVEAAAIAVRVVWEMFSDAHWLHIVEKDSYENADEEDAKLDQDIL
jgi:hypothetical protein